MHFCIGNERNSRGRRQYGRNSFDNGKGDGSIPSAVIAGSGASVTVKKTGMTYGGFEIGSIEVIGVNVLKDGEVYYLQKGGFTTIAKSKSQTEDWNIAGISLKGNIENGILTLRVEFKPGSMPANLIQIFTSENNQ